MTILHSSKEQKQKPKCLASVVLNLWTLKLQSLKSDSGTRLVLSNCFVVYTVNFPENQTGTNFSISSARRRVNRGKYCKWWIWSNFYLFKDGAGYRLNCYNYRVNTILFLWYLSLRLHGEWKCNCNMTRVQYPNHKQFQINVKCNTKHHHNEGGKSCRDVQTPTNSESYRN